jgi:DNA repair exonuclease SbcCD ATPase subunit
MRTRPEKDSEGAAISVTPSTDALVATVRDALPLDAGMTYHPEHSHVKAQEALDELNELLNELQKLAEERATRLSDHGYEWEQRCRGVEKERDTFASWNSYLQESLRSANADRDALYDRLARWEELLAQQRVRAESAEARVKELEQAIDIAVAINNDRVEELAKAVAALRLVRDWIREGKGTESAAAEAMDAALGELT